MSSRGAEASTPRARGDLEEEGQCRSSARRGPRRAGRAPVAGPWAANAAAPADERVSTWAVSAWSGLEAAGLAMIIGGAIGHDVTVNVPSATPAKVSVVPLVAPQAGMLSLRTSW